MAILVVAMAVLPLIQSGTSIHKRSYLTEYHVIASLRARTLLNFVSSMDFDLVHQYLARSGGTSGAEIVIEDFFESGELEFLFAAPSNHYRKKIENFSHVLLGRPIGNDMLRIEVVVNWRIPGERRDTPHEYRLATLLQRPEFTASNRVPTGSVR